MKENGNHKSVEISDEIKELVITRIEAAPSDLKLSMGGGKLMSKEDYYSYFLLCRTETNTKNMKQSNKHLTGEGEMDYDYVNDILFFKVKDRKYDRSLEFENMVIDVDADNFIVGIQIFDASKFLRMDKSALRAIPKWTFQAYIDKETIEIRLNFQVSVRNQLIEKNPIIIQRNDERLPESEMAVEAGV